MILNVSGRTDIVALYSKWFMNRYKEGFVDVRNPFNEKLVSRIYFKDVDLIMFCTLLKGYVNKIIVSFLDDYKNVRKNMKTINYKPLTEYDYEMIGKNFSKSAKKNGMIVQTCFEDRNLVEYGFTKGECISHELAYKLTGKTYKNWTARKGKKCNCVKMVDIGAYNTCKHFCKYCYANYDENQVIENYKLHDPNSSLLVGNLKKDDIIKIRIV